MSAPVAIGIDVATAHLRAVAIDATTGAVLASRAAALPGPSDEPDGGRRQEAVYAPAALGVLTDLVHDLGRAADGVVALSTTATSGTVVPCAADGSARGDALLYNDRSAVAFEERLRSAGTGDRPVAALARMALLHATASVERFGSPADVVNAALAGGPVAADTSHHLKAGIDPTRATWPDEIVAVDLPRRILPDLVVPGTTLGHLHPQVARTLGLDADVLLVAGMTDGCTAQIATGAVDVGDSVGVLGTTLVLKAVASTPVEDATVGLYSHLGPDGRYWPGGASNTGAGILEDGRDVRALDAAVGLLDPHVLLRVALSYPLTGRGERFPFADPAFEGLLGDPKDDAALHHAGILLGVAHVERLSLEAMRRRGVAIDRHRLAGGGSRSEVWNAIRAAVIPAPVLRPQHQDSAFGAAVLAACGVSSAPFVPTVAMLAGDPVPVEPFPGLDRVDEQHDLLLARLQEVGVTL